MLCLSSSIVQRADVDFNTVYLATHITESILRCEDPTTETLLRQNLSKFTRDVDLLVLPLALTGNYAAALLTVQSRDPYVAYYIYAISDKRRQHDELLQKTVAWLKTPGRGFFDSETSEDSEPELQIYPVEIQCPSTAGKFTKISVLSMISHNTSPGTNNSGPAAVKNLEWLITHISEVCAELPDAETLPSITYEDDFAAYRKRHYSDLLSMQSTFARLVQQNAQSAVVPVRTQREALENLSGDENENDDSEEEQG